MSSTQCQHLLEYIGYLAGYGGNQSGNVNIGTESLFTATQFKCSLDTKEW